MRGSIVLGLVVTVLAMSGCVTPETVTNVDAPPAGTNPFYISNRAPLEPSAMVKLPIGSIEPRGWLRKQLELEASGMVGHMEEISKWCKYDGNAWVSPEGVGHSGWEEMPYWLKGYGDLGYVLKDEQIKQHAKKWIDGILISQQSDGWFGPASLRRSLDGKPDLWPQMLVLNVMQSYYEASGDPRVIRFMRNYFRWQQRCLDGDFLTGFWPTMRAGDNLESIYWLYNRTPEPEPWLLELAKKVHAHTADWTGGIPTTHGVNIAQGFREPAIYWLQSKLETNRLAVERNYQIIMNEYGQVPGGMFAADENYRPGCIDPRQAAETCSMVEFMHSFEMLTRITGQSVWADRCEDVAFNSLPAATTADFKALHYLTAPNQVLLDRNTKSPGVQNAGTMFSYSAGEVYRCCQHNVAQGWPYLAEELWLATSDEGLCASIYAPSSVYAKVLDENEVTITEDTPYPFGDTIRFTITTPESATFPLYLRVPGWCHYLELRINGRRIENISARPGYIRINRQWNNGDKCELKLPIYLRMKRWEKNRNAVSIQRGPLWYSLQIPEEWRAFGDNRNWPDWEVRPGGAWNYGLVLDDAGSSQGIEVVCGADASARASDDSTPPFDAGAAPVKLRAKARKTSTWQTDSTGLVGALPESPVQSTEPTEDVTLIPMGAARLRVTAFPVMNLLSSASAHPSSTLSSIKVTASFVSAADLLGAVNDGLEPTSSSDSSVPRFTWLDHKGTEEWIQYDFDHPRRISGVKVYWCDDESRKGPCRLPVGWLVLCRVNGQWSAQGLSDLSPIAKDRYTQCTFNPVTADAVKLIVQLRKDFSAGILEMKVLP